MTIDITGNWHEGDDFSKGISVHEQVPMPPGNIFNQTLLLPSGCYKLRFIYDKSKDHFEGMSLLNRYDHFSLLINRKEYFLDYKAIDSDRYSGDIAFSADGETVLQMKLMNTRPMDTYLEFQDTIVPNASANKVFYAGIKAETGEDIHIIRGIPFILGRRENKNNHLNHLKKPPTWGSMQNYAENPTLNCGDIKVWNIYFLGMIHDYDISNGSWYSPKGDHGFSHFAGDQGGSLIFRFSDGSEERVPLIFGFNVWYGHPWDLLWDQRNYAKPGVDQRIADDTILGGNEEYRQVLKNGIGLDDAVRRMDRGSHNQRYLFTMNLEGRQLHSIDVTGSDEIYGFPQISAITMKTDAVAPDGLRMLPIFAYPSRQITIHSFREIGNKNYLHGVEKIKRILYTHVDELPILKNPEKPCNYFGPFYDFRGVNEALLAATYLYYNGPECAAYIADTGTQCSSSTARWRTTTYTSGLGVWLKTEPLYNGIDDFLSKYRAAQPGYLPGVGSAWTRGCGELMREAMAFGYDKFIDNYTDWLDNCLLTEANPPHWNRVAGDPHGDGMQGYTGKQVGDIIETGNRENDGHGICMWGRYMMWWWKNQDIEWNRRHWKATKASVEWIQWQLDTDTVRPGRRLDILYTESECAHGDYDFYSSFNCLHGIKLAIRMAEQLNEKNCVERWNRLYQRLGRGIIDNLKDNTDYGCIWHTEAKTDWQDHAHKLAHLQLAADGDTYTPLEDYKDGMDAEYLETDIITYKYLMKEKNYNCLRMYGYGQGMMSQSALLLDQMEDAEQFVNLMVTHNYLPRMEKWISPEGIITHRSGRYYVPVNGYMGQDSHVADSTKAVRLMLGIDDNRRSCLHLVPRFPASWTYCAVADYPVLTKNGRGVISYTIRRDTLNIEMDVHTDRVVDIDIRLGPFAVNTEVQEVMNNKTARNFEQIQSGDRNWIWVRGLTGDKLNISVTMR
jgi:hypothetical protein